MRFRVGRDTIESTDFLLYFSHCHSNFTRPRWWLCRRRYSWTMRSLSTNYHAQRFRITSWQRKKSDIKKRPSHTALRLDPATCQREILELVSCGDFSVSRYRREIVICQRDRKVTLSHRFKPRLMCVRERWRGESQRIQRERCSYQVDPRARQVAYARLFMENVDTWRSSEIVRVRVTRGILTRT